MLEFQSLLRWYAYPRVPYPVSSTPASGSPCLGWHSGGTCSYRDCYEYSYRTTELDTRTRTRASMTDTAPDNDIRVRVLLREASMKWMNTGTAPV
eukprot:scaffold2966_cov43-Prasinocladus_malaysianus.AAC.1